MKNINKSIKINAPKEKVWDAITNHLPEWGIAFAANVGGSFELGELTWFIQDGMGMKGKTTERRENEFLKSENVVVVINNVESTDMGEWAGSGDSYKLTEENGVTTLEVETIGATEEDYELMSKMWDEALEKIKNIAEK